MTLGTREETIAKLVPSRRVSPSSLPEDRRRDGDTQRAGAIPGTEVEEAICRLSSKVDASPRLDLLRFAFVQRQQFQQAELRLSNQIKSIKRRLEKEGQTALDSHSRRAAPSLDDALMILTGELGLHLKAIANSRLTVEKNLIREAKKLPVWTWVEQVNGAGALTLGNIIGETGDLGLYGNPAKVWKRMGLGLVDGERQRRVKDAEQAERHGYNPRRRALMHVVGTNFLRARTGPYRTLYDERKDYELARGITKGHAHNRALRYIEKRFLRDLWREWTKSKMPPIVSLSALTTSTKR